MNEVERILNKKEIKPNFLKEETICDFVVSEKRKKVWIVGLDLLLEFDKVCKKHNLNYILIGGTLLGAIRHNGYIPWDADIDVGMLRADYEKLLKLSDEFANPYFLQTPYTDPGYYYSFAKLRNSNTSAIAPAFRNEKFNQGIFLDIFPLDNCKIENVEDRYNRIKELNIDNSTFMRKSLKNPTEEEKMRIASHSGSNPMEVYEEIQEIARAYENVETEYVNLAVCTIYTFEKLIFPKNVFDGVVYHEFEDKMLPIPKGYDEYLKICFGDYMKFPPKEKRGAWHNLAIYDTEHSYKEKQQF